jgi:hypothetical protein
LIFLTLENPFRPSNERIFEGYVPCIVWESPSNMILTDGFVCALTKMANAINNIVIEILFI